MSGEVIRLDVIARYRAGEGVEVDSGRRTFQVEQRTRSQEADSPFCPIELVVRSYLTGSTGTSLISCVSAEYATMSSMETRGSSDSSTGEGSTVPSR